MNKCQLVRDTCVSVVTQANHVHIRHEKITALTAMFKPKHFRTHAHHQTALDIQQTLLQLFVLDSLNFCFWPLEKFEYADLALAVQQSVLKGLSLKDLQQMNPNKLLQMFSGTSVPLLYERARILRQLGQVISTDFNGSFSSVLEQANHSAVKLLDILTRHFSNFQDHAIYKGQQIHFYKRAQILIGDIWGHFDGQGLGQFHDIDQLTMFPDYRVPQVLHTYGVLEYSKELEGLIMERKEIIDREYECEIRAATVEAVELIKKHMNANGQHVKAIDLDWFLWELGEDNLPKMHPHHRVLTIYY